MGKERNKQLPFLLDLRSIVFVRAFDLLLSFQYQLLPETEIRLRQEEREAGRVSGAGDVTAARKWQRQARERENERDLISVDCRSAAERFLPPKQERA